ncbi:hypothetical protein EDD80_103320 [Anseongella ginsenosidimutans]|uniref:Uncharacterized protein n=1 Tax=Anseongella ginsenosidimutans TaxID=496056 RepID=A0A4R3KUV9_9SPHI|nr:hypothetical protein EDD80_103320 [Anseongella ginsenosidimutans]
MFWVFCIRETIRKVMIVVPVLITSCQVSENPKTGPVTIQALINPPATINAIGEPATWVDLSAILSKNPSS